MAAIFFSGVTTGLPILEMSPKESVVIPEKQLSAFAGELVSNLVRYLTQL